MHKEINPSIIARETLKQLAMLKMHPTPDNYQKLYYEISGVPSTYMSDSTVKMLSKLANKFPRNTTEQIDCANTLASAVKEKNWDKYQSVLINFLIAVQTQEKPTAWGKTIPLILKQLEVNHGTLTVAKKRDSLSRVLTKFAANSVHLHDKLLALVNSWSALATSANEQISTREACPSSTTDFPAALPTTSTLAVAPITTQQKNISTIISSDQLRALLTQVLMHVAMLQPGDHTLVDEAKILTEQLPLIDNKERLTLFTTNFSQFIDKLSTCKDSNTQLQQSLLRLFNLLMDKTSELLSGDEWLQDQFALLRKTLSSPISLQIIEEAEQHLKDITRKQNIINYSLNETKVTLKRMITSLISNIEELSDSTDDYHKEIGHYAAAMHQTEDISVLSQMVLEIASATKKMQERVLNSRNDFLSARAEVTASQNKINQLETELLEMDEQAHKDHLTDILNRRGLDNVFKREAANSEQRQTPMCLALIDIDDFKKLNDTYGHQVGDEALVYLVDAMKETTRSNDIVARFGGEEFIILLPEANVDTAISVVSRVRRSLTKRFFLNKNKRLLITFSAGVAEYQAGETQQEILSRADKALYQAKNNGKNQVVAAS